MASVTSRYARALVDVVLARGLDFESIRQQLASLRTTLESSADLRRVWETPAIPFEQKLRLLDAIAARLQLARELRNFTAILIQHHRTSQLPQIVEQFEQELNQRANIAEAEITSARDLDPEERQSMQSRIEDMTGKRVRARYSIDRGLLGGAVIRIGSTIYDGSVRGQMDRMKEQLAKA